MYDIGFDYIDPDYVAEATYKERYEQDYEEEEPWAVYDPE